MSYQLPYLQFGFARTTNWLHLYSIIPVVYYYWQLLWTGSVPGKSSWGRDQFLGKETKVESGLQVFWRALLGDTSIRKWGSQSGQREKLTHIVVATETSADPPGSSEAEMAPQSCPKLIRWDQIFVSLHQSVTGHELLPRRGHSQGSDPVQENAQWGLQLWAVSNPCSQQLGEGCIGPKDLGRAPLSPLLGVCNLGSSWVLCLFLSFVNDPWCMQKQMSWDTDSSTDSWCMTLSMLPKVSGPQG